MQWQPKVIYITLSIVPAFLLVRALWHAYMSETTLKRKVKSLLQTLFMFPLIGAILFSFPICCIVAVVEHVNWDGNNLVEEVTLSGGATQTRHYSILNGEYHGHYQEKDVGGLLVIEGQYENGIKVGEWKKWYPSGQLESQEFYKNGEEHGVSTRWHENGQKSEKVTLSEGEYLNDFISWHPNGQISQQGFSSESGVCKKWYKNGQIAEVKEYNGRRLVSAEVYLPDGKECPYTNFLNGNGSVANWLSWDNNFNEKELPNKVEFYENGIRVKSTNN